MQTYHSDTLDMQVTIPESDAGEAVPTYRPGDGVTIHHYSDCKAATVVRVTPFTVTIQFDKAELLNGVNSGEPDALKFDIGGFAGHTSGKQRWHVEADPTGATQKFTLRRSDGRYMEAGSRNGAWLSAGRHPHYDFNF